MQGLKLLLTARGIMVMAVFFAFGAATQIFFPINKLFEQDKTVTVPANDASVLSAESTEIPRLKEIGYSVPVTFNSDAVFNGNIIINGVPFTIESGPDTGSGESSGSTGTSGTASAPEYIYASSSGVLTLQGMTGDLDLTAGTGISIDVLEITNTDPGSTQNIFKNVKIPGIGEIIAGSNNDSLTLTSGAGINLAVDSNTKNIAISQNVAAGLTQNGLVYADSPSTLRTLGPGPPGHILVSSGSSLPVWVEPAAITNGSLSFADITDGTSLSSLTIGSGSVLGASGTGIINATQLLGSTWGSPGDIGLVSPARGKFTDLEASGSLTLAGLTPGIARIDPAGRMISSTINLDSSDVTGFLPVSRGGTGADTPAGARANLNLGSLALENTDTTSLTNYLPLSGGTMTGVLNSLSIIPTVDNASSLGSSSKYFANTYTNKLFTKVIAPVTDSTTALQITKANGTTNILNIDSINGFIGIGTTSARAALDIGGFGTPTDYGTGTFYSKALVSDNFNGISGMQMYNSSPGTNADFRFSVLDNNKKQYLAFSTPSTGNNQALFGALRNTSNFIFNNTLPGGVTRNLTIGTVAGGDLIFGTSNLERLRILNNGYIGIGTTSARATLDIGGFGVPTDYGTHYFYAKALIADNYHGVSGVQMYNSNSGANADFRFSVLDNTKSQYMAFSTPSTGNNQALFGALRNTSNFIFNNTLPGGVTRNLTIGTVAGGDLIFGTSNLERLRILNNGYIGIGTTSPTSALTVGGLAVISTVSNGNLTLLPNGTGITKIGDAGNTSRSLNTNDDLFVSGRLEVDGLSYFDKGINIQDSQAASVAAQIFNTNTGANADGLAIKLGNPSATSVATSNHFLSFETSGIGIVGSIQGNGNRGIQLAQSGIADYAEYMPKDRNTLIPDGSLVCMQASGLVTGCTAANKNIVGIASPYPLIIAGENLGDGSVAVGLAGIVETRVSTASGAISPGDLIAVSAESGVGVRAVSTGLVAGRALEGFSGSGTGKIRVVVSPQMHFDTSPDPKIAEIPNPPPLSTADINSATISGSLSVLGRTVLSETSVTGRLSVGLITIDGLGSTESSTASASINTLSEPLKLQSSALAGIDFLDGKVTIDKSGNVKILESVTARKYNVDTTDVNSASLGRAILPAGQTRIKIDTTAVTDNSSIFLTPIGEVLSPLFIAEQVQGASFTVGISKPEEKEVRFSWFIVN